MIIIKGKYLKVNANFKKRSKDKEYSSSKLIIRGIYPYSKKELKDFAF